MDLTFSDVIALAALIISMIGAVGGAYAWQSDRRSQSRQWQEDQRQRREDKAAADRKEAQRRSEVVDWAMKAIATARGAVCQLKDEHDGVPESELTEDLRASRHQLSILLEQGRIYFKNQQSLSTSNDAIDKSQAYRGWRPRILDQLIILHDAIRDGSSGRDGIFVLRVAERAQRELVSLLQMEIGRAETVSEYASEGGSRRPYEIALAAERRAAGS